MGYAPMQAPPFAPKPKNHPTPKKDNPVKDAICHQCGEVGHWRRNCPVYLTELMKNKKLSQGDSTSGIFTIELYYFPSTSWVYDTGCGTHICITTQGLKTSRKLKTGALSLYVGDGHRAVVEAIGEFHLCLPKTSLNSDSTLLWHCRLGHINKKRIEKLQHDGLLDSTDIKSFEKCVSCMSGKMARKPYSHQVERDKDLLGLSIRCVCQTTIPKSFWDYALESVARILNMVPTKKVDKTPCEVTIWLCQKEAPTVDGAVDTRAIKLVTYSNDFQQNPGELQWTMLRNILKSSLAIIKIISCDRGDTNERLRVSCYSEAGYLTVADDLQYQSN
ncbi:zinc finger, CCHC-type containing protein [Tanacetum coccineum]